MPKKVKDNEPNRADEYVQRAAKLVAAGKLPEAINLYYLAAELYRSEGLTEEAAEAEHMAKAYFEKNSKKHGVKDVAGQWKSDGKGGWEYYVNSKYMGAAYQHAGQKPFAQTWEGQSANCATLEAAKAYVERYAVAKDELQPVPVGDALSDRQKLERRREIEAALAHSDSIGSRAEELAYRKSVSRSKETAAQGERLYKAIQAARAKLVVEYKELGGDVSRVSDEELKPVPVGKSDPERIKPSGPLGEFAAMKLRGEKIPAKDRRKQLHQALDRMLGKDTRSPQWQPDSPDKPLLNDLHKSLETLGHSYKYSGSGPDKGSIKHTYSEGANLVERKNGKHGIGYSKDAKHAKDELTTAYRAVITSDKMMLGGTKRHESSPFPSRQDAESFAEAVVDGNKQAGRGPCTVEIKEVRCHPSKVVGAKVRGMDAEEKVEAYGVKGMKSTKWRKVFANQAAFEKWLDANEGDVEVQGTREAEDELLPIPVNDDSPIEKYNAARQAESEAKLKTPAGEKERQARNAETLKRMRGGKDSLNKRELEDRLASVSQAFETACEGATAEEAQKAGATIKQAKNALKTNSSLQACSILVSAAYAQVNKMGKSGVGKDEEPMKSVVAHCPTCKGAQTHLLTPEGPKCKRCLAKGKDSPDNLLSTAQSQEIAQDRKAALDSYRKAASAFRSTGDQKMEAVAREGIDECQRKLVGGVDSTYQHPSTSKVQAFDSADRALTSAIQRTRAGERVRMARDSATGETVVEPVK